MRDNHIHVGQFKEIYYDPIEITDIVMSTGMESMAFSSTSSCIDNISYPAIEKEILSLLSLVSYSDETIRPFLWYIPDYINQNISIESMFAGIPYKGIKVHPFAHNWDFSDTRHLEILHKLFDYAARDNLPVLIHTGYSGVDRADRFVRFMVEYRDVKIILAHCCPLETTIELSRKHNNVYCDISFVPEKDIRRIASDGLKEKIVFGSDFPITHFFKTTCPSTGDNPSISLREQYAEDIASWEVLENEL